MVKMTLLCLCMAYWGLTSRVALAESSNEFATMGRAAWNAFECSVLAEKSNKQDEKERLFNFGYSQGLKFINALQAEKIDNQDISKQVPMKMVLLLQGPTPDFMLGRVFDSALEHVLNNVSISDGKLNTPAEQEAIATDLYWNRNCQLIGK